MINRPIMCYHGGKFRLAPWIISHMPAHRTYVELFGGAGGVLARKPRSFSEVYNDLSAEVVNVFRVLRDPALCQRLAELCALTPYALEEYVLAYEATDDPVEQARQIIYRTHAGYGSSSDVSRGGFCGNSKRSSIGRHHLWARFPPVVAAYGERFTGVIIDNRPALKLIGFHDTPDTLFYADPPYLHQVRYGENPGKYQHEMTDADHEALLGALNNVEGHAMVSGYDSDLYRDLLPGWPVVKKIVSISADRTGDNREECLWLSPGIRHPRQEAMFGG